MATQYDFDVVPAHVYNVTASSAQIASAPQQYYEGADIAWMMISSALVLLMVPGNGLLYSGTSSASAISMMFLPIITTTVVGLIWFLWGYAIAFSPSNHTFWGGTDGIVFHNVTTRPVGNRDGGKLPEILYALYQGMFACFTASVLSGAPIYKEKHWRFLLFIVLWTTFVYAPIARWTWNPQGWSNKFGSLDFAGGTAVHITSGAASAAWCLFFRLRLYRFNRRHPEADYIHDSTFTHQQGRKNIPTIITGTVLLWIGWFGFNGGSALGANTRAVVAIGNTNLSACAGGVMACLHETAYEHLKAYTAGEKYQKPSDGERLRRLVLAFSNGVVVGLVSVTPAAGYIPVYFAPFFGIIAEFFSFYALRYSSKLFDSLDIFAIHCVGGFVGMMLTALFARRDVAHLDGYTEIAGGANTYDHYPAQLYKQLADALAGFGYSFTLTFLILCILEYKTFTKSPRRPKVVLD